MTARLIRPTCETCHRALDGCGSRGAFLPAPDFCVACGKPMTERARELEEVIAARGQSDLLAECRIGA